MVLGWYHWSGNALIVASGYDGNGGKMLSSGCWHLVGNIWRVPSRKKHLYRSGSMWMGEREQEHGDGSVGILAQDGSVMMIALGL